MDIETKNLSISALRWTVIDRVSKYVIVFFSTVVLARVLGPKAFGVISMLYIFISLSSLFIDFGMGGGLVRKEKLTTADCSTFFYFNVLVAIFLYILLFFLAPYIAIFYKEPQVTNILRVLCLTIPINSLTLIHKELLIRELKVKYNTRASLLGSIISTAIGIFCAYQNFGIWSLVILQVSNSIIYMIVLWLYSKWLPTYEFSYKSLQEFLHFGLGLFLSSFINTIFANVYQVLIGLFFSVTVAGLYYQARRLFEIPVLTVSNVVDSITYPILVKFQKDNDALVSNYSRIVKLL
ncbi:MAG: lipopolysaccharide biosynthesis protein, partial [Flavitalea sp.]